MGLALGPVQARSSEDTTSGAQLIEIDVQIGDQPLAVGREAVVSLINGLQGSGGQQPLPELDAATAGKVVVTGASLSQGAHLAVLAQ